MDERLFDQTDTVVPSQRPRRVAIVLLHSSARYLLANLAPPPSSALYASVGANPYHGSDSGERNSCAYTRALSASRVSSASPCANQTWIVRCNKYSLRTLSSATELSSPF